MLSSLCSLTGMLEPEQAGITEDLFSSHEAQLMHYLQHLCLILSLEPSLVSYLPGDQASQLQSLDRIFIFQMQEVKPSYFLKCEK